VTNLGTFSPVRTIQMIPARAFFPMSPDGHVKTPMGSPRIGRSLQGLAKPCGVKQNISQPRYIALPNVERVAKYSRLVPATRVRRLLRSAQPRCTISITAIAALIRRMTLR
jgi:hypothetical protein